MRRNAIPLACGLATLLAMATPASTQGTTSALAGPLTRFDEAWTARHEPARLAAARAALDEAERMAPGDFEVEWREARWFAWISDDAALSKSERSRLGKRGWDHAERALKLAPDRIEGHFYAAINMGNYALGLGILKALSEGIEGKFKERLSRAEAIDPRFDSGTIYNAWGRFWYELPWPKYSAKKSEAALRKALEVNPASLRARVYLAELQLKQDDKVDAKKTLQQVLDARPGAYDEPEERRMQERAQQILQDIR